MRMRNSCQASRRSASVPCAKRSTSGFCSVESSGTRPVPSISSCHQRISRSCCAGVASFSHSAYCATELAASLPAKRCALRNWFTVSKATSSGPSPKGVKLRGFIRTYISWSVEQLHRARLQLPRHRLRVARRILLPVPPGIDADRRAIHRPQHRRPLRIAGRLHLDGAEAARQRVFDHLLDQRAKAVRRHSALPACAATRAAFAPRSATSSGRTPRRTRTCQSMAAMRSLITLIARRTSGVSANRRRFTGVGLGRCRPETGPDSGSQAAPASCAPPRPRFAPAQSSPARLPRRRLPPHLPQLFAYLHAHLPSKTKGMAQCHAFLRSQRTVTGGRRRLAIAPCAAPTINSPALAGRPQTTCSGSPIDVEPSLSSQLAFSLRKRHLALHS